MILKWTVNYPAYTGEEERTAYLYLPAGYEKTKKRYPVLYMFDGHNVFFDGDATYGKSWGMGRYLAGHRLPLIVAALECNHSPDNGRLSEYSPYDFSSRMFSGDIKGRGRETMDWFVNVFKPYIDSNYRTLPDREHTFIMGSSMGGLMSVYALLEYNHIFSRAAALSPSLWVDPKKLQALATEAKISPDSVLYMDYGSEELHNHAGMTAAYGRFVALLTKRGLYLTSRIVPGGTHCEASWEKQLPFCIGTLLYDVKPAPAQK